MIIFHTVIKGICILAVSFLILELFIALFWFKLSVKQWIKTFHTWFTKIIRYKIRRKIKKNKAEQAIKNQLKRMSFKINKANNPLKEIVLQYSNIYMSYIPNPLSGIIDHSLPIDCIYYQGGGDCGIMAWVYEFLFTQSNRYKEADIKVYSFFAVKPYIKLFTRIKQAHIMCVVKYKDTYYLGDYNVKKFGSIEEIKQYYADTYLKDLKLHHTDIDIVEIKKGIPYDRKTIRKTS